MTRPTDEDHSQNDRSQTGSESDAINNRRDHSSTTTHETPSRASSSTWNSSDERGGNANNFI